MSNNKPHISFEEFQEDYLQDGDNAKEYIKTAIEDYAEGGNLEFLLLALREVG